MDGTEQEPGLYVLADRQRLRQVLLNLLSNAVKYNRNHGRIMLSTARVGPDYLRLNIADTGHGIAPELLPRIFTPFERLGAEQAGIEGTGLGLALSKALVEVMGGRIGVDSTVGQGSNFWLELPLAADPRSTLTSAPNQTVILMEALTNVEKTVLYIEDNLASYQLMERVFARFDGIRLISAMQGSLGLDLAQRYVPDLILLDLHLPDIHGQEVLRRLRADTITENIPVIVTSADATSGQVERLLGAGANDYLTKPLDLSLFAKTILEYLGKSAT
jgi:CheY-like chemotaxis protein